MRFFHKPGISPGHTLGMSQTFLRGNYCVSVLLTASFGKQGTALSCYSYTSLFAVTGCAFDESRHLRYSAIQISHLPASFLHTRGIIRNAPGLLSPSACPFYRIRRFRSRKKTCEQPCRRIISIDGSYHVLQKTVF